MEVVRDSCRNQAIALIEPTPREQSANEIRRKPRLIPYLFNPNRALVLPATVSTRMPATAISGKRALTLRFMAGFACVAAPISRLISLEVVEALRTAVRHRSGVTVMRIEPVVDMSVKAVRAV